MRPIVLSRTYSSLCTVLMVLFTGACGPTTTTVGAEDTVASDVSTDLGSLDLDAGLELPADDSVAGDDAADSLPVGPACKDVSDCPPEECNSVQCLQEVCVYLPLDNGAGCDDDDLCTLEDTCNDGTCSGTALQCPAPTVCTTSSCDSQTGQCSTQLLTGPCDDQNVCTTQDHCEEGLCVGAVLVCDDQNPCTDDTCDNALGCFHSSLVGLPCQHQNPCVVDSTCDSLGDCSPGGTRPCDDGFDCTQDQCDPETGTCLHVPLDQVPCTDGNACTDKDHCVAGSCLGTGILCEDNNLCTQDLCSPSSGCLFLANTLPCDDLNPCTENDRCGNSVCQAGSAKSCSDGNPCTLDLCDPTTGLCQHQNTDWPCDDLNLCTTQDRCLAGLCIGIAVDCRDTNPCTSDSCDASTGCAHAPISAPCEDGNLCTLGDLCANGTCKSGLGAPSCNDNNPCTSDTCSAASGLCLHTPSSGACDDGNPCTLGDSCQQGTCSPGPTDWCECASDLDCAPLDDSDRCNGILHCDTTLWPYRCRIIPSSVVLCDTQFDSTCKRMRCQPETGNCLFQPEPDGIPCNDGNYCTTSDVCAAGECSPQGIASCADDNPCVVSWCDPLFGCQFQPNNVPCSDGNACTTGDRCSIGICMGINLSCNDNNPCTSDYCDPLTGQCSFSNSQGGCNDGNPCTVQDTCVAGLCSGQPRDCNDGKPCTADACEIPSGCVHETLVGDCSDGNECTAGDTCVGTACVGTPVACNDLNPCTDDSCVPATGCLFAPNTSPCDDDSYCTTNDTCQSAVCAGKPVSCDDGNPCTANDCHPYAGCLLWDLDIACDDSNACTTGDWCVSGHCLPGATTLCQDFNACTLDQCNTTTGVCSYTHLTTACDDSSLCTTGDTCLQGQCVGTPVNCNDSNVCTSDSCFPSSGCQNLPLEGAWCTDGNLCTDGDSCSGSACLPGPTLDCDDHDPCTNDSCEPALGCLHDASQDPMCLACGPLFPIDGATIPAPGELQVSLDTSCPLGFTWSTQPIPSLTVSAQLPPECPLEEIPLYATTPLPAWPSTDTQVVFLHFNWSASICPDDSSPLASVGLVTQEGTVPLFIPQKQVAPEACGNRASLDPQDTQIQLTLRFDWTSYQVEILREGLPTALSPVLLDPLMLPTHLYFHVRSLSPDAPELTTITWLAAEVVCP